MLHCLPTRDGPLGSGKRSLSAELRLPRSSPFAACSWLIGNIRAEPRSATTTVMSYRSSPAQIRHRMTVLWLDHPMPMAYSVAGRPGFVVATKGLSDCLTASEREAVIAHERAHLRGHHHRIINVCEVFAKALPVIPLFKAAPAAVRRLVELAADDRAAQATSPDAVRSALRVVATSPLPQPVWTLGAR